VSVPIEMTVNGERFAGEVEPRTLLVDLLRERLHLTSVHIGCEHGVCGTCTIQLDGKCVRSCITFAVSADGAQLTTAESLATAAQLHPLQEAFWEKQGLQCGYCTPGMLMVAEELLRDRQDGPPITADEVRKRISSNLCRCTGYTNIIEAVLYAAGGGAGGAGEGTGDLAGGAGEAGDAGAETAEARS
jgi:aerobic-type carbon monoxide dehydrogenase small subunit (CoxS/CutS family)